MLLLCALVSGLHATPASPADSTELIVGVFPRRSPSEMVEMFSPLANRLSEELKRPVRLETTPDFGSFWTAVASKRYHLVHYNQYHYVRSRKEAGYQVVAKNEEGGQSTITGVLMVRKDSGLRTIRDLRGKKIVFGGNEQAMGAYILPTYMLRRAGLDKGDYRQEFAINPTNVSLAVFFRQADAGGSGNIVFSMPFVRDKIDVSQMEYLARSEPVAQLPWAVRGDLGPAETARLRQALLNIRHAPNGEQILKAAALTGLVSATDDEYNPVRRIIRTVTGEKY